MNSTLKPPFVITPLILRLVEEIGEGLGRLDRLGPVASTPMLRRGNRIRSVQASLAIEGNTLGLEQVTAILEGRRVLGSAREIQEVRNAIMAYEQLQRLNPSFLDDLLEATK